MANERKVSLHLRTKQKRPSQVDLGLSNIDVHPLDLRCKESISGLRETVEMQYGRLDVLVQNAAVSGGGNVKRDFVGDMLKTNFWGPSCLMKEFYELLGDCSRVVFMSSMVSMRILTNARHPLVYEIGQNNTHLTERRLEELAETYTNNYESDKNLPRSCYGVSKILINGLARVYAEKARKDGKNMLVNSCCPGFVKTDMNKGNPNAKKLPVEGAKLPFYLATLPESCRLTGAYLSDA